MWGKELYDVEHDANAWERAGIGADWLFSSLVGWGTEPGRLHLVENAGTPEGPDRRLQHGVFSHEVVYRSFPFDVCFSRWIVRMSGCDGRMAPRAYSSVICSRIAACMFASIIVGSPDYCIVPRTNN